MKTLWIIGGFISLAIGMVGAVTPILPTVPLVLLAAFCFARGSEKLHQWLLGHKTFGPMIDDWNTHGAIHRKAKIAATVSVIAAFALSVFFGFAWHILAIQAVTLTGVMIFIWTRPDR